MQIVETMFEARAPGQVAVTRNVLEDLIAATDTWVGREIFVVHRLKGLNKLTHTRCFAEEEGGFPVERVGNRKAVGHGKADPLGSRAGVVVNETDAGIAEHPNLTPVRESIVVDQGFGSYVCKTFEEAIERASPGKLIYHERVFAVGPKPEPVDSASWTGRAGDVPEKPMEGAQQPMKRMMDIHTGGKTYQLEEVGDEWEVVDRDGHFPRRSVDADIAIGRLKESAGNRLFQRREWKLNRTVTRGTGWGATDEIAKEATGYIPTSKPNPVPTPADLRDDLIRRLTDCARDLDTLKFNGWAEDVRYVRNMVRKDVKDGRDKLNDRARSEGRRQALIEAHNHIQACMGAYPPEKLLGRVLGYLCNLVAATHDKTVEWIPTDEGDHFSDDLRKSERETGRQEGLRQALRDIENYPTAFAAGMKNNLVNLIQARIRGEW